MLNFLSLLTSVPANTLCNKRRNCKELDLEGTSSIVIVLYTFIKTIKFFRLKENFVTDMFRLERGFIVHTL